jgi:anti-sigma28 factor (negative regulator of flagellin synthesis)
VKPPDSVGNEDFPMKNHDPKKVSRPGEALTPEVQGLSGEQLKQMALAVIARTPEVRRGKVQVIKESIEKGSYHPNSHQVAVNLIAHHFCWAGPVACQPGTRRQNSEEEITATGEGSRNPEMIPFNQ